MSVLAAYFVFGLTLSLALNPLYRRAAQRLGYVEHPRDDRWHTRPTAPVGGPAIATTLVVGVVLLEPLRQQWLPLLCAGAIFVLGTIDDVRGLRASSKLVVQIALASVLLFFGYRLGWSESLTLDTVLTLLWIVGITNAFNLLDNMDGLCAGVALIAGFAMFAGFGATVGTAPEAAYLTVLLGATAGFLVYNLHPAGVFLGDSGSLLIGLSLAVMALAPGPGVAPRSDVVSIIAVPVLILLIPILDSTLVTVSRVLSGRLPSQGGKDHSSHRLVAIGLSEPAAVALLWGLAATGGLLGFAIDRFGQDWTGVVAALFLMGVVIFAVYLSQVRIYEDPEDLPAQTAQVTPLVTNFLYKRRVAEIMLDVGLISIAYYAAYRLRFEEEMFSTFFPSFLRSLPVVLGIQVLALFGVGGYRGVWRYFGLMDGVVFAKGVLFGTLVYRTRFFGHTFTLRGMT